MRSVALYIDESRSDLYCVFSSIADVVLPEKPKLKFLEKVPNLKQAKKEMKKLRDIQGPAKSSNTFTKGQYGIVVRGSLFYLLFIYLFWFTRLTMKLKTLLTEGREINDAYIHIKAVYL